MTNVVPCWYCGSVVPGRRGREHKTPKRRGGGEGRNLVPTCSRCNRLKGNMTVEEWRADMMQGASRTVEKKFHGELFPIKPPKDYWHVPSSYEFDCACGARIVVSSRGDVSASMHAAGWADGPRWSALMCVGNYDDRLLLHPPEPWRCPECEQFEFVKLGWRKRAWPSIDIDPCGC